MSPSSVRSKSFLMFADEVVDVGGVVGKDQAVVDIGDDNHALFEEEAGVDGRLAEAALSKAGFEVAEPSERGVGKSVDVLNRWRTSGCSRGGGAFRSWRRAPSMTWKSVGTSM